MDEKRCANCGMQTTTPAEYHPWAVCELFRHTQDSRQTLGNIRAVVEYGMKAQELGVSIDDAMSNISTVIRRT